MDSQSSQFPSHQMSPSTLSSLSFTLDQLDALFPTHHTVDSTLSDLPTTSQPHSIIPSHFCPTSPSVSQFFDVHPSAIPISQSQNNTHPTTQPFPIPPTQTAYTLHPNQPRLHHYVQENYPSSNNVLYPASPPEHLTHHQTSKKPHSNVHTFKPQKQKMTPKSQIRKLTTKSRRRNQHSSPSVCCHICSERFENKVNAERHLRGSHPTIPHLFQCPHCTASYESKGARTIHQRRAHPETLHETQLVFNHLRLSPTSETFVCRVSDCPKRYTVASNLKRHIEMAHLGKRYPCQYCDYAATTKSNLKVHENRMHGSSSE